MAIRSWAGWHLYPPSLVTERRHAVAQRTVLYGCGNSWQNRGNQVRLPESESPQPGVACPDEILKNSKEQASPCRPPALLTCPIFFPDEFGRLPIVYSTTPGWNCVLAAGW